MTEHSPAAIAAFPDKGGYIGVRTNAQRSAFDLGAATTLATTREALIETLRVNSPVEDDGTLADAILASGVIREAGKPVKAEILPPYVDLIERLYTHHRAYRRASGETITEPHDHLQFGAGVAALYEEISQRVKSS